MLTSRQEAFKNNLLKYPERTATQNYTDAGFSERTAAAGSTRLLKNVNFQLALARGREKASERAEVDATYVMKALHEVSERSLQRAPVMRWDKEEKEWVQCTDENGANIWAFNASGANGALAILSKCLGMQLDKLKIENPYEGWTPEQLIAKAMEQAERLKNG